MLLRHAVEDLIKQAEEMLEGVEADMLANTDRLSPDSSEIPDDRREEHRISYQKELRKRIRIVQPYVESFVSEAELCSDLYGDLEAEGSFLFNGRPGDHVWAIIITKDALIQTNTYDHNLRSNPGPSIVFHRLQDIDRLSVQRTDRDMTVNANLHKARHDQYAGVFTGRQEASTTWRR